MFLKYVNCLCSVVHNAYTVCPDEQCEDRKQQVGAELCQAQVKLEVVDEDEVKVRS